MNHSTLKLCGAKLEEQRADIPEEKINKKFKKFVNILCARFEFVQ